MDFELSTDQEELRDEFRRLLSDFSDHDARRAAMGLPGAVDRRLWGRLAETGVFALRLPEDAGGIGAGMAEAVVIHEEIGRAAAPGPVAVTGVLAAHLPGAADGSRVVTALFDAAPPLIVEHLDGADTVALVTATKVRSIPVGAVVAESLASPLDPLTPVHRVTAALPAGEPVLGPEGAARVFQEGTLLTAATQVGLAAAAVEMATAYAKERMQFGRAIGSFQAVKHLIADAHAETEVARAAVHSAAVGMDEAAPATDIVRAVAGARVLASRVANSASRACIQVHGGMGYTWDLDAHLLLKRTLVLDTHFDTPQAARARLLAGL
jgi:alkylation response protein AidB-like acyl-CoA dehydrogenase